MSLQTRLEAFVSAVGADVKSLLGRVSNIESRPATTVLDGGATSTEPYTGIVVTGGGHMLHVGPTNELPLGRPGVWVDTSVPDYPTFWIEDGAL